MFEAFAVWIQLETTVFPPFVLFRKIINKLSLQTVCIQTRSSIRLFLRSGQLKLKRLRDDFSPPSVHFSSIQPYGEYFPKRSQGQTCEASREAGGDQAFHKFFPFIIYFVSVEIVPFIIYFVPVNCSPHRKAKNGLK